MSARDVIYDRLTHLPGPHKFRDLSILGIATEAEEALTAAGWRLVGPDEVDPVTVERCAVKLEGCRSVFMRDGAAVIRALTAPNTKTPAAG